MARTDKTVASFWTTVPGILTGFAATLTAIGSLIVALHSVGIIGAGPQD